MTTGGIAPSGWPGAAERRVIRTSRLCQPPVPKSRVRGVVGVRVFPDAHSGLLPLDDESDEVREAKPYVPCYTRLVGMYLNPNELVRMLLDKAL